MQANSLKMSGLQWSCPSDDPGTVNIPTNPVLYADDTKVVARNSNRGILGVRLFFT